MLVSVQLSVAGLYLAACVQVEVQMPSTPNDHFTAGPDCRVSCSGSGRVGGAGGCPTVRAGIVSTAGVKISWNHRSAPDDHSHCQSRLPCESFGLRRVGGTARCPTIRAGIVSPASVKRGAVITPPQTIISLPVHAAV